MQKSFSDLEYANKKKLTRRDRFLAEIDKATPWGKLHQAIEPFYPKVSGPGRPPIGGFVGIDLNRESAPDATTLLKFRHLLEANGLTRKIFDTINAHLAEKGLMMREGTIVDATLIAAPPSTKNKDGERDPEMHQSKKGNDWHFGMKAHVGVDATSGLVHTLIGTAGNVSDVTQAGALLHGDEIAALGDAGYQGVEKREENKDKTVTWHVAMKRSKRKALPKNKLGRMLEKLEHLKASVRAKVEHPFHVIKNLFRHRKTRYRGLAKNTAQLFTLFGFANLVLAGRRFTITET